MGVSCVEFATRRVVYFSSTETAGGYQLGRTELKCMEQVRRSVDRILLYLQVVSHSPGRDCHPLGAKKSFQIDIHSK